MMKPCKFFEQGYCKFGNKCQYQHISCCRAYNQGFCKFGVNCCFPHIANLLVLPVDILKIFFEQVYLSDLLLVNKLLNSIINTYYPLQLYLFTKVMDGGYTSGCAMATARNKNDAIYKIAVQVMNGRNSISNFGLWDRYGYLKIRKYEEIDPLVLSDHAFGSFVSKYRKDRPFRGFRTKNRREEIKEAQISMCNIYFELMREKKVFMSSFPTLTVIPLNYSIGFFNGGGS